MTTRKARPRGQRGPDPNTQPTDQGDRRERNAPVVGAELRAAVDRLEFMWSEAAQCAFVGQVVNPATAAAVTFVNSLAYDDGMFRRAVGDRLAAAPCVDGQRRVPLAELRAEVDVAARRAAIRHGIWGAA